MSTRAPVLACAAYIRTSTDDQQSPEDSKRWQLDIVTRLVAPAGGVIVATYHDIDVTRERPWARRPEASRLLAAAANPARGWRALVIAEPQRAFSGGQFQLVFPQLTHYGVELWVPEPGRASRPRQRGPRDAHEPLRWALQGRASAPADQDPQRRARSRRGGALARGTTELRLPARRHPDRAPAATEGRGGDQAPCPRSRPGHGAGRGSHLRDVRPGARLPDDRQRPRARRPPEPRRGRPDTPSALGRAVGRVLSAGDPDQPPLPRSPGRGPAAPPRRSARPHQPRRRHHQPAALAADGRLGHLG